MKRIIFRLIIFINSIALAGIFVTQVYWVYGAYHLKTEQFAGSVRIAMKGVANQMLDYHKKMLEKKNARDTARSISLVPDAANISESLLEFKITEEFNCMKVGNDYEYALMDLRDHSFLLGNFEKYPEQLKLSKHQIPLVGFNDSEYIVLAAYFPDEQTLIVEQMFTWLIISVIFAILLLLAFYYTLYIFYKQKRLSEMKTDFINNMTHEFKTPLATISLASEMLRKEQIRQDPDRTEKYARIIFDENSRLQNQVEQILHVSLLERGQFRLKKKMVDLHALIRRIAENYEMTVKERNGTLKAHYCAKNFKVFADPDHLTNVIMNLLDNANKYSPITPQIRIGTFEEANGVIISVEDKGMGISEEDQHMIFRKLYRVSTGNLYTVKGFGIGLYYVKTIVEAHGGHIKIKSELNKGSRFDIFLPINQQSDKEKVSNETEDSPG